ncbi:MAG: type IV secretory system conjugative DNA transfer family protein [Bacilli bacterium]|nr:type IV secretory system conjugative DNA transfer family protein [Bacilli bacterium]
MNKNIIIDGVLNAGKTKGIIFPIVEEILKRKESFIVSDSKKEYYNYYSEKARDNGYNVCVINIENPSNSNSIDIFELPYRYYKEGRKDEAFKLLDILTKSICLIDESTDPFWGMSAGSLILGILVKIMEDGKKEELNFKSVYNVLAKFSHLDNKLLNNYFNTNDGSVIYQGAASVLSMPPETRESVIAVAKNLLFDNVIYEDMVNMLNNASIKLDDVEDKPLAMFVITSNVNCDRNIIFNMIYSQLDYVFRNSNNKFNVILDNFDELKLYNFKQLFVSSNSYDINMILATRDLSDLTKRYSDYLFKVADVMHVSDKRIRKTFDGKEEISDLLINDYLIEDKDFPELEKKDIKTFNIYEHVSSELINSIASKGESVEN